MTRVPVSVVVPCRDRPDLLDRCLASLFAQLRSGDEVIVADSASTADLTAVASRHGARVVRCGRPGASRARNAGWRAATNPVVAFVDDDVIPDPGWLDAISAALAEPRTGFAVGPYRLPDDAVLDGPSATLTTVEPPPVITAGSPGVFGAGNLALPHSVLDRIGGFDERLGPGCWIAAGEDMEMLDRVLALGLTGRYAPDAVGRHLSWRSRGASIRLQWAYGLGMGGRVAAAVRRDRSSGLAMVGTLLRLGGLSTAIRRLRPRQGGGTTEPEQPQAGASDVSGWIGPVLWRLGAVTGFVVGLGVLAPRRQRA